MRPTTRRDFLQLSALAGLSQALGPLARAAQPSALPFPELTASGSAGALGLEHGRTQAPQIERNITFYVSWLSKVTKASPSDLLRLAGQFAAPLARHLPAQLEEIDGIARGAGRRREEILLLNARTDLLVLGRRQSERPAKTGCTALALTGRSGGKDLLALGQNWDWVPDLAGGTVLLRLAPARGPQLVTFTEAGMLAKIGFNAHRLGVCLNFLGHQSEDPQAAPGIPIHCLLRHILEQTTLEQAIKEVAWLPRCASANFLLAQPSQQGLDACSLELTPTSLARLPLAEAGLVHTNHFKDPTLAPGCDSGRGFSTINRDQVATTLAARLRFRIPDPVARMKHILASRSGAPDSVSKTPSDASHSITLAGIVMDLSHNRLHLTVGPPHQGTWVTRPGV